MDSSELKAIKKRVDAEPDDERGKLARELLAEIERLHRASALAARAHMAAYLVNEGMSSEEAERVMAAVERGEKIEYELGPCRACEGSGSTFELGCAGGHFAKCRKCGGRKTVNRIKVPG